MLRSVKQRLVPDGLLHQLAAFSVPQRQGVHWPQLSSSKNRIRLRAAARTSSWSERTTMAADPMKQPYGSSVPKSSGTSARCCGQDPAGSAAGQVGVERVPLGHAAAVLVDQLAHRDSRRCRLHARALARGPRPRSFASPCRPFRPWLREPVGARD